MTIESSSVRGIRAARKGLPASRSRATVAAVPRAATDERGNSAAGRRFGVRAHVLAAVYALAQFVGMSYYSIRYHEMWRDEIQAWLIARDTNVSSFFLALRYEGHPGMWHLMLVPLAKSGLPVQTMQVLAAAVAAASTWMVLRFAPFPVWLRVLFSVGYLQFYEWGVMSRNYGLGVLLILVWCALITARRVRWPAVGFVLLLISQTSLVASLLVPALCLYSVGRAWSAADRGSRRDHRPRGLLVRVAALCVASGLGMVLMYLQARPEPDNTHLQVGHPWSRQPTDLFSAFLPISHGGVDYWQSHAFLGDPWGPILVTAVVTAGALWVLRRNLLACSTYALGFAALTTFFYVRYPPSLRHLGFYEVLLVACLWLATAHRRPARRAARPRFGNGPVLGLLTVVLVAQAAGTPVALLTDRAVVFSDAKGAAKMIAAPRFRGYDLLLDGDFQASPILGYLGRKATYVDSTESSYIIWNKSRMNAWNAPLADTLRTAAAMYSRDHKPILVVSHTGLASPLLKLAAHANGVDTVWDEKYLFYTYAGPGTS